MRFQSNQRKLQARNQSRSVVVERVGDLIFKVLEAVHGSQYRVTEFRSRQKTVGSIYREAFHSTTGYTARLIELTT